MSVQADLFGAVPVKRGLGEIARGDPLPPGPYAVGMTHTEHGDEWPYTVVCGDGRAIAGHVNSKACAEAIVDALNRKAGVVPRGTEGEAA